MKNSDKKGRIPAIVLGVLDIALLAGVITLAAGGNAGTKEIKPGLEKNFVESPADYSSEKTDEIKISDIRLGAEKRENVKTEEKKKAEEAVQKNREEEKETTGQEKKKNDSASKSEKKSPYDGFVFPDSNKKVISDSAIREKLTSKEKYLQAVNELYARHGYGFKEEPFKSFFGGYAWYRKMEKVSMKAVEEALSAVERENLRNLLAFGRDKGWR